MAELVKNNLVKSQREQKRWYEQAGDQVLVLLLARWQGPYPVFVSEPCDVMYDKHKHHRILHVNMLWKWNTPITISFWTEDIPGEEQDEVPVG